MFLYVVIAFAVAFGLIQLGALSVWVSILSLSLKIVVVLVLGIALYLTAKRFLQRSKRNEMKTIK